MPELPEVERGRRVAEGVAVGRVVTRARCSRDLIVYDGCTSQAFRKALVGQRVTAVRRRGKHIWFELDARPYPVFHFGMTGGFHAKNPEGAVSAALELASHAASSSPPTFPPKFTKLHLSFDDGGELAMDNARRLGRIRLRDDPERELPVGELGFDALDELPAAPLFVTLLRMRSGNIKSLLLDQSFLAGIGNWIADEVLYQARIDPRRKADSLTKAEGRRLRLRIATVLKRAVDVEADKQRFPRSWLFHHRWGRREGARTQSGHAVVHIRLGGRTTAWVPDLQK